MKKNEKNRQKNEKKWKSREKMKKNDFFWKNEKKWKKRKKMTTMQPVYAENSTFSAFFQFFSNCLVPTMP